MTIRTNAHPVILNSHEADSNAILMLARECGDTHDSYGWAFEVLFAVENMRMAYDSPRIGGGIDPTLATNLPGLEAGIEDSSLLEYLYRGWDGYEDWADALGLTNDQIQDCIVHAEAVADRLINLHRLNGTDY